MNAQAAIDRCWSLARAAERDLAAFAYLPETPPGVGTGPLAGVAVAIKDLIDTADMPTSYGAAIHVGHQPVADAAIVKRLRSMGATVLGKTVTTEFAHQQPGPTRNPWNLAHTPGGSSSGSAAAVAAGIVPLAVGTQTMGSIIRPAAFCGIVGYKPTFGTISRDGVHPLCEALDHVGLFARSVAEIETALRCLDLLPAGDPNGERPLRLAALTLTDPTIEPAQRETFDAALRVIRQAGHGVDSLALPSTFDAVPDIVATLLGFEAARHFGALVARHRDAISAPIRGLVADGKTRSRGRLPAKPAPGRPHCAAPMPTWPPVSTRSLPFRRPARRRADSNGPAIRASVRPGASPGVPALTFPVGFGPSGLPLGLQVVGHWGRDAETLTIGARLAELFPAVTLPPAYRQAFGNSM